MRKLRFGKQITAAVMAATMFALPLVAQTRISAPSNKYKVQDDIKLGNDASREVERRFPILNDGDATGYVERVGQNLVNAIPQEFRQPSFDYRFKVVNARDINAFALPGGPMYVNRGMIEAARNEGEMAGVMAHEISHIALRHATAQATKQGSWKNQLGTIGLILGGAILGGQTGAQLGMLGAQAWMTKYSREYETQADLLGARIMADAGYDPSDLANMFRTIAGERTGGSAPEWLSSHPDPGNRFTKINNEARYLNVSRNPIKLTRDFERIKSRFRSMPRAPTLAEIEKSGAGQEQGPNPTASGRYSTRVPIPSTQMRTYNGRGVSFEVPSNWRDFPSQESVQFAPEGAYGDQGITHGAMAGLYGGQQGSDLRTMTESYVSGTLQANSYLRQRTGLTTTSIEGRRVYSTQLSGRSPVTGSTEIVTIYTTQLRSGDLLYIVTVAPSNQASSYNAAFNRMLNSVRFSD